MRAWYSASLLVVTPSQRCRPRRRMPFSSSITTPMPAGPGLPRDAPSVLIRRGPCASLLQPLGRLHHRLFGELALFHESQLGVLFLGEAGPHVLDLLVHLDQLARAADAPAHELLLARTQPRAVSFSVAVGLAKTKLNRLPLGPRAGHGLLRMRHAGIGSEKRFHPLDLVAQLSLPLHQSHVREQELRGLHSSTTRTWPSLTTSPSFTRTSFTVPARGAVTGISIFIDSRIRSSSSSATCAPTCVLTFQTLPTSSALTSVITFQTRILRPCSTETVIRECFRACARAGRSSCPVPARCL